MSDEDTPPPVPDTAMWLRPLGEQVAAIRHDQDGIRQEYVLLSGLLSRMSTRLERMEVRQDDMVAQLATRPTEDRLIIKVGELIKASQDEVLRESDRRWTRLNYLFGAFGALILLINTLLLLFH